MSNLVTCLWYDGHAEEAATFYASIFPDASVSRIDRAPSDYPMGKAGDVLVVEFTMFGQRFIGLNGGPGYPFTQAISLQVPTADQAETDLYWDALLADGGCALACGWLRDKFGLHWQITPVALTALMASSDPAVARRVFEAMMTMVKIDIAALERAARGD
jgi:predicted 3-demethylubiquinone-9 3-methyltransferase (glyoxalase superfamily)